jgi:hypothetical protein
LIVDIGGKIRVEGVTGGEVISPIPGLGPHRELISMLFDQDLIASELHVARQPDRLVAAIAKDAGHAHITGGVHGRPARSTPT